MWSSIQRLTEACIPNNALVLLDIDDTVVHLDGLGKRWWQSTQSLYYEMEQCPTAARSRTLEDWIARVYSATPTLIDPAATRAFLHTLESAHATLVFLTARNADLREITLAQLSACGLEGFPVLHAEAKGEAALEECRKRGAGAVVFIDDMEKNVADVVHHLTGPDSFVDLHAYLFSGSLEEI